MKVTLGSKVWSCLRFIDGKVPYDNKPTPPWEGEITDFPIARYICISKTGQPKEHIESSEEKWAALEIKPENLIKENTLNIDQEFDAKNDNKNDNKNDQKNSSSNDSKNDTKIALKKHPKNATKKYRDGDPRNGGIWFEVDQLFATEKECWIEYKRLIEEHLNLANDTVEQLRIGIENAQRKIDEIG